MNWYEQLDKSDIEKMGVAELKKLFENIMGVIGLTHDPDDLAVLAVNAGKVWWEMVSRGVEFK